MRRQSVTNKAINMRFLRAVNFLHTNKASILGQLRQQRVRRGRQTAINKYHVKRALLGLPLGQCATNRNGIINAQILPDISGLLVKRLIIFQRDNGGGQSGQNGSGISGATGNIQHHIIFLNIRQFNQQSQSCRRQHGARRIAC